MTIVLVGVGNPFRRDDGVGPAAAAVVGELGLPGVTVVTSDGEPSRLLEAWTGAGLAVVVDAVWRDEPVPGRMHRSDRLESWHGSGASSASSHGLGLAEAVRLGRVLDRLPGRLVLFGIEGSDFGLGPGLSADVAAALPGLAEAIAAELTGA